MASTLLPFRDYDEHDVINLFAFDGELTKGHMVMMVADSNGWRAHDEMSLTDISSFDLNDVAQSHRYGVAAKVVAASGAQVAGDNTVLGMTLYDVKETDENGEKLVFNPRKAAEMEVALSGQAVPILTKGIVLYSGSALTSTAAGQLLYHDDNGDLTTTNTNGVVCGVALGSTGENGEVLVKIDVNLA